MQKIAVLTSGGDAPGMNAAIRAIVRKGIDAGFEVYGIRRGYSGLLEDDFRKLGRRHVADILHKGGTMLKTSRCSEFATEEGQKKAAGILKKNGIDALIVIGGDGSMRGAADLSEYGINVMCLPGTIDNDVNCTDFTIGFDTAVNTVLDAVSNVRDTSAAHDRAAVIEVMGRHCGDIAIHAGIAGGAEWVCVPEFECTVDDICRKIRAGASKGKIQSIIINAEGSGFNTFDLVKEIEEKTGRETRPVVLSYIQRGGSPTAGDRMLATLLGIRAVELIEEGRRCRALGVVNGKTVDFDIREALEMPHVTDKKLIEYINILSK